MFAIQLEFIEDDNVLDGRVLKVDDEAKADAIYNMIVALLRDITDLEINLMAQETWGTNGTGRFAASQTERKQQTLDDHRGYE